MSGRKTGPGEQASRADLTSQARASSSRQDTEGEAAETSQHQTRTTTLPQRLLRQARSKSAHIWQSAHDATGRGGRDYDDPRFLDEILQARREGSDSSGFAEQYTGGDDSTETSVASLPGRDTPATRGESGSKRGGPSGSAGTGIRVWYESYTTIDWIHDAVKESSRLRRIRSMRGMRGLCANLWDGVQGWIIVTITGIVTALIAGGIVSSEAVLFDLKEGYCEHNWRLAKRFCCPYGNQPDWDGGHDGGSSLLQTSSNVTLRAWTYGSQLLQTKPAKKWTHMLTGSGTHMLTGWASPTASSYKWKDIDGDDSCPGWVLWGDKLKLVGRPKWIADYGSFIGIAIIWASVACLLTIYLTSSELYTSKKDLAASRKERTMPADDGLEPTEQSPLLGRQKSSDNRHYGNGAPSNLVYDTAKAQRAKDAVPARKVLYFGSGSGISEIKCILSGFVIHGYLGFWTLFTKSVGLTLAVASGLSLGKEGPFVHIASCVGNIVCRVFPKYETNESKRREVLSCACAAGVAVAFGAPVGGVLFSLEEVSYYFPAKVMFRSFFCAMVAAATLRLLDPFGTGKIVLFQVTYDRDWHEFELGFFVLIGLFGGLYGAFFTRMNMLWSEKVRGKTWLGRHPLLEVILITLVSVMISFLNDYTRMSGPELIADLFSECHEHHSLDGLCVSRPSQIGPLLGSVAWTMLVKGVLTIVTFGVKLPAGIFIPTLAVGACFGRLVGLSVQYAQWTRPDSPIFQWCPSEEGTCIVPGVYAMVGAAAALSGVTRTTISLVVIMFELTGTLEYAVPVMLAVLVARTVADALERKSIYDLVLDFSGLPYLDAKEEYIWSDVTILDALDTDIETISLDDNNTVASLQKKLQRLASIGGNADGGLPIVTPSGDSDIKTATHARSNARLAGYISASELEHGLNQLVASNPHASPSQIPCTFKFLPRPALNTAKGRQADTPLDASTMSGRIIINEAAEHVMRHSSLLASMDEPHDLSLFVDRAPLTLTTSSPLELVHQLFVKLGVRYLVVLRPDGTLKGVIFKKRWLAFLHSLDHKKT